MCKVKDLYFFLVVLYSGMALTFFRSHVGLIVLWLIGLLIFSKETIHSPKRLFVALGVWLAYFIINTIIIRSFHPMFMGTYIAKIMIAYWLLNYYKERIFLRYEDVIYKLTVIILFIYAVQLLFPTPLYNLFKVIDLSQNLFPHRTYASIGVYTYHQVGMFDAFPRNSGFTWEPGPYSCYIVLAIFINIIRNKCTLQDHKRLLIYAIALLSTQSTTGFLILLLLIVWYTWLRFRRKVIILLMIPIVITFITYIFINVPWMQEKIISESEQNLEEFMKSSSRGKKNEYPGRFVSLQIRFEDFKKYPIAGFGGNDTLQTGYLNKNYMVSAVSGIGHIIGRYGAIGTIIFLLLIFKTGISLGKLYNYSGYFIFPLLILMIGFSFNVLESPLVVTLWMFPFFLNNRLDILMAMNLLENTESLGYHSKLKDRI